MKPNPEFDRFKALLSRVVNTPRSTVERRAKEEAEVKAWREKHGLKPKRHGTLGRAKPL